MSATRTALTCYLAYSIYRKQISDRQTYEFHVAVLVVIKGEGKRHLLHSAAYMSQTRDQHRFTISEVAADWHEPMVPQRIMAIHCPR